MLIVNVLPLFSGNDAAVPGTKTVDSFSFLHHPVHQRSLEILQRCKDEKYSKSRATFSFFQSIKIWRFWANFQSGCRETVSVLSWFDQTSHFLKSQSKGFGQAQHNP